MAAMHNAVTTEPSDTEAMRIGRLAHEAVLNPAWPVPRWHSGHIPDTWTAQELVQMRAMHDALFACEEFAVQIINFAALQTTIEWTLPGTGGPATGTPDILGGGYLVDYKVARSIETNDFVAQGLELGYHAQLAYYRNGVYTLTGSTPDAYLIAQQSTPPYTVRVFSVDSALLDSTFADLLAAAEAYRVCEAAGVFPPAVHPVTPFAFAP